MEHSFRFESKHIGLTYPKCDIDKLDLADHLWTLCENMVRTVCVSHELH